MTETPPLTGTMPEPELRSVTEVPPAIPTLPTDHKGGDTIRREDIEAKLRELHGEVVEVGRSVGNYAIALGVFAAVGVVALAFRLGKRRERKRTTIVEVRRV
jgi:hypothetical protein